ncbi:MAG: Autotransporter adhesin [Labilithrix sp.]|nr:Autotransporter adhesin [Labilithrix sp.]
MYRGIVRTLRSGCLVPIVALALLPVLACSSFGSSDAPAEVDGGGNADSGASDAGPPPEAGDADADAGPPPVSAYSKVVLADSPLAYFTFDDGAHLLANHGSTPAHGVFSSTTTPAPTQRAGIVGSALAFPTGADQLAIVDGPPYGAARPFTIEAWVRLDVVVGGGSKIFTCMDDDGADTRLGHWAFVNEKGHVRSESWGNGGIFQYREANEPVPKGTWFHLVHAMEASGNVHTYVNAVELGNGLPPDVSVMQPGAPVKPLTWREIVGGIDELALYDVTLSATKVASHYIAGVP